MMGLTSGLLSAASGFLQGRDDREVASREQEERDRQRKLEEFNLRLQLSQDPSLLIGDEEPAALPGVLGAAAPALAPERPDVGPQGLLPDAAAATSGPPEPDSQGEGVPLLSQMIEGITVPVERRLEDLGSVPLGGEDVNVRRDPTQTPEARELRKQELAFQQLPREQFPVFIPGVDFVKELKEFTDEEESSARTEEAIAQLAPTLGEERARNIIRGRQAGIPVEDILRRDERDEERRADRAQKADEQEKVQAAQEAVGVALALAAAGRSRSAMRTALTAQFGTVLNQGQIESVIQQALVQDLRRQQLEKSVSDTASSEAVTDILSRLGGN